MSAVLGRNDGNLSGWSSEVIHCLARGRSPESAAEDRPCRVDGCMDRRWVLGTGHALARCRRHEIERIRRSRERQVTDPATGETVSINALRLRRRVIDPDTGEVVTATALQGRKKVVDPATGEVVRAARLSQRRLVVDPETGEVRKARALADRTHYRARASHGQSQPRPD